MQVTCGAEWSTYESGRRSYAASFDADDGRKAVGAEQWDAMSSTEQLAFLEKRADLVVVAYMCKEGAISQQFFEKRVLEIKSR